MSLKQKFSNLGLDLEELKEPVQGRGNADTFFMDIVRTFKKGAGTRHERFRIYPGHKDNRVEVVATDKKIGQLVMLVQEPKRSFWMDVPYGNAVRIEQLVKKSALSLKEAALKINNMARFGVRKVSGKIQYCNVTPENKRHYLLGFDERQLFIAQLPKACTTVRDAHACLKSVPVTLAEGKVGKATRQGEWFFVDVLPDEQAMIDAAVKLHLVLHKEAIGIHAGRRGGKPHVAEDLLTITGRELEHGFAIRGRPEVFVRGAIRHPDHKTVTFTKWKKVLANAEGGNGNMSGIGWID